MRSHAVSETVDLRTRPRKLFHKKLATRSVAVVFMLILLVSTSRWGPRSDLVEVLYPLGILLAGLATAARLWTSIYHAGYKNDTLLTVGPYSLCRNPMYFCNFVGVVGAALTTGMLTLTAFILGGLALYYPFVVSREERALRKRHGEAFEAYRRRTPAFLPDWRLLREPEEYITNIRLFRTKIGDSITPFVAVAAFSVILSLHVHGLLPHLLQLY